MLTALVLKGWLKCPMSSAQLLDKWGLGTFYVEGANLCISYLRFCVCVFVYLPLGMVEIVHCAATLLKCPMSTVELVDKWRLVDMTHSDQDK